MIPYNKIGPNKRCMRGAKPTDSYGVHMGQLSLVLKEVLPMASDLLTIVSFVLFVLEKLLTFLSPFPASLIKDKTADNLPAVFFFAQPVMSVRISFAKVMTMPPARVRKPLER